MEMFVLNEEVTALESTLLHTKGAARLATMVSLAWHLRQRDSQRALLLADDAQALLESMSGSDPERQRNIARLLLVKGEVSDLFTHLEQAETYLNQAIDLFTELNDHVGVGDARWLLTFVFNDQGKFQSRDKMIELTIDNYRTAGDETRLDIAIARRLLIFATYDSNIIDVQLVQHFCKEEYPPSTMTWLASARGCMATNTDNPGSATKTLLLAYHSALETGQIRQAIIMACNSADSFASLGDLDAALELDERALVLAQSVNWPCVIGFSLLQTANVLRLLGRLDDAKSNLLKALEVMVNLNHMHSYMMAMLYLGEVSLDQNDTGSALTYFQQVETLTSALRDVYYLLRSWRGQANALGRLGQPQEAIVKAAQALSVAQQLGNVDDQIQVLRVHAELHHLYTLPAPVPMQASNPELHYLQLALGIAANIDGYIPPSDLLDQLAGAYAAAGDFERAYHHALSASSVRHRSSIVDARNRAIAMQIHQETASIRAETEERLRQAQKKFEEGHERAEAADRAATQANLRALQAQIEPHFLFNSLANVVGLIHAQPDIAKTMLEKFIAYLRASLAATRQQETSLGNEFALMGNFLAILQIRMGDRLRVELDLPDELAAQHFPSMLLQPLIENAIKHGLEPKIEGGSLSLQARKVGDFLRISVADTGLGFQVNTSNGIGLNNARERIDKLFDGKASLIIEDNKPCGTRVIILTPFDYLG